MPATVLTLPNIGDTFKDLVWDAVIKYALGKLFEAIPFLGKPIINLVVTMVFKFVAEWLYDGLKGIISFENTFFVNNDHRKAYDNASVAQKIIARDKGIDSPEFRKARDANKKALSDLTQWIHP